MVASAKSGVDMVEVTLSVPEKIAEVLSDMEQMYGDNLRMIVDDTSAESLNEASSLGGAICTMAIAMLKSAQGLGVMFGPESPSLNYKTSEEAKAAVEKCVGMITDENSMLKEPAELAICSVRAAWLDMIRGSTVIMKSVEVLKLIRMRTLGRKRLREYCEANGIDFDETAKLGEIVADKRIKGEALNAEEQAHADRFDPICRELQEELS